MTNVSIKIDLFIKATLTIILYDTKLKTVHLNDGKIYDWLENNPKKIFTTYHGIIHAF